MKSQTETSGLAHLKSAHQLSAELTKISEISEHGRDKRRLKEESVRWDKKKTGMLFTQKHCRTIETKIGLKYGANGAPKSDASGYVSGVLVW